MKANELRIGNWVFNGRNIRVIPTQIEWFSEGVYDLLPIPLTEEWLLKFGFEQNKLSAKHNSFIWYENHIGIKGLLGVVKPYECKHVHQLQNLYFALTGEELKLKEISI